jgi:hypothetical protein
MCCDTDTCRGKYVGNRALRRNALVRAYTKGSKRREEIAHVAHVEKLTRAFSQPSTQAFEKSQRDSP